MKQTQKQKAVTNQINQIRNSIKLLQKMTKQGLYVDAQQKRTLECICSEELAPLCY
jgi:hypothetical protein